MICFPQELEEMNFCELLKELRLESGLTQKEVAKGCGLTPTCICQLETGARTPMGATIAVIAKFFDVSTDYLLGLEDDFGARVPAAPAAPMSDVYSSEERKLIEQYRKLPEQLRELVRHQLAIYSSSGELLSKPNKKV